MRYFRNLPIKQKVILVILLSSMTTLLMASAAMFAFQCIYTRKTIARDLTTHAEVMAANSTAALSFRDAQAATEILAALRAEPHILEAALYLPNQKRLAHYGVPRRIVELPPGPTLQVLRYEGSDLVLYQLVQLEGRPLGMLYLRCDFAAMQREFTMPFLTILGCTLAASFVLVLILSSVLQRLISGPILRLAATARAVAERKDYSVRADFESRDELGLLTQAFNHMLSHIQVHDAALRTTNQDLEKEIAERKRTQVQLEDLHRQMLGVSRQAGMAEVATGVLHNVGNVLNSINVTSTLVIGRIRQSKLSGLAKAVSLIESQSADLARFLTENPKGRQLPAYLVSLSRFLSDEREFLLKEMELLRNNIDHIKEIVAMQQSYARAAGVVEVVKLTDLVEDAVKLNAGALARHGVDLEKHYEEVPVATIDKHKVLQILINLIRNAKYALDDGGRPDKLITLKVAPAGASRAVIQVIDNGVGIPPENLTRIFAHGFTTRPGGHGFGLHSGALAAREMGGALTGHSEGPGRGATFTLELPLNPGKRS